MTLPTLDLMKTGMENVVGTARTGQADVSRGGWPPGIRKLRKADDTPRIIEWW
jgi:hypothetical protein